MESVFKKYIEKSQTPSTDIIDDLEKLFGLYVENNINVEVYYEEAVKFFNSKQIVFNDYANTQIIDEWFKQIGLSEGLEDFPKFIYNRQNQICSFCTFVSQNDKLGIIGFVQYFITKYEKRYVSSVENKLFFNTTTPYTVNCNNENDKKYLTKLYKSFVDDFCKLKLSKILSLSTNDSVSLKYTICCNLYNNLSEELKNTSDILEIKSNFDKKLNEIEQNNLELKQNRKKYSKKTIKMDTAIYSDFTNYILKIITDTEKGLNNNTLFIVREVLECMHNDSNLIQDFLDLVNRFNKNIDKIQNNELNDLKFSLLSNKFMEKINKKNNHKVDLILYPSSFKYILEGLIKYSFYCDYFGKNIKPGDIRINNKELKEITDASKTANYLFKSDKSYEYENFQKFWNSEINSAYHMKSSKNKIFSIKIDELTDLQRDEIKNIFNAKNLPYTNNIFQQFMRLGLRYKSTEFNEYINNFETRLNNNDINQIFSR